MNGGACPFIARAYALCQGTPMPRAARSRRSRDTIVGKLRAADPFELIRWLARSQPDPRKALAELVQNSIDAGAHRVQISRRREKGVAVLQVFDDGEGVIPELDRTEALTYIATNIGHSRKRNLSPEQRRELLLQGKYGIGLLGFWSIGRVMEMRTQMHGTPGYVLRMFEDSPRYEIERLRSRLSLPERYTEIVIRDLHRPAFLTLGARRIADYLAAELRGQLLARDVEILVHDRIARGRAPKALRVEPVRFSGQLLDLPRQMDVPGFGPMSVELYVESSDSPRHVTISCGGTAVYDDISQFDVDDFNRPPWSDHRLSGLLDFPDFQVAPGTRRGVFPDQAALAFAHAVRRLEPLIVAQLKEVEERAAASVGADLLRQLERAFRDLHRLAPEYDFFSVRAPETAPIGGGQGAAGEGSTNGDAEQVPAGVSMPEPVVAEGDLDEEPPSLLPAGPLVTVRIVPAKARVERLAARKLRAEALDVNGVRIRRGVDYEWSLESPLGRLSPLAEAETIFQAGSDTGSVRVTVTARQDELSAQGESIIEITEAGATTESARAGIPEPVFVREPQSPWRSRMNGSQWEVNSAHPSFLTASETPRRKLRYLTALLAKEVVVHSFPGPQFGTALERLVEVITITERRLEKG